MIIGDAAPAFRRIAPMAFAEASAHALVAHDAIDQVTAAADQGSAEAQFNIGKMYVNGRGVAKDYAEGVTWYRKAADQGNADAQYDLGIRYANGISVPQDYVQAYTLLDLAAARFRASENPLSIMAVKERDGLALTMTPAQIAEA